jgi:hypothetical protein
MAKKKIITCQKIASKLKAKSKSCDEIVSKKKAGGGVGGGDFKTKYNLN